MADITPGRITEAITFHFDNEEQQKRFHDALNGNAYTSTEALRARISQLETAAQQAVSIIGRNLYHQREKVEDACAILKDALSATECQSPTHERDGTGPESVGSDQLADANSPGRSSTEALRSALERINEALYVDENTGEWRLPAAFDANFIDAALSGSPAPSTEGLECSKR